MFANFLFLIKYQILFATLGKEILEKIQPWYNKSRNT